MTIEQKVITVSLDDITINDEIALQAEAGWTVNSLVLTHDDSEVVILFNKITIT